MDTIPIYGIVSGYTTELLPGYQVIPVYISIPLGINTEYKILDKKFSPVIGLSVLMHFDAYIEHYEINDKKHLYFGLGKSMSIDTNTNLHSYWKIYLNLRFYR